MTRDAYLRAVRANDRGETTPASIIVEVVSYEIGGYLNACSDNGYTPEQARQNFYTSPSTMLSALHRFVREELDRAGYRGVRFYTNEALDNDILDVVGYSFPTIAIPDIRASGAVFDFSKTWVYA